MSEESVLSDLVRRIAQSQHSSDGSSTAWTVALSGGVDSMVLLHVVMEVAKELNIGVRAVHVNHGLRSEAERDSRFVREACEQLGVPLDVKTIDISELPRRVRKGVESDARTLRYEAIAESVLCGPEVHQTVFLGHHADDQIETILMRLVRGSSLTGLAGIRPVRRWQGIVFVRPFLTVPKSQIEAYAALKRVSYVQDDSNFDRRYTRNFLRHEVVPKLLQLQPNLGSTVSRLAQILQAEDDWLQAQGKEHFLELVRRHGHALVLDLEKLQSVPLPLQRRVIKIILYCLAAVDWTFDDVDSILSLCSQSTPSATLYLKDHVLVRKSYRQMQFLHRRQRDFGSYRMVWWLNGELVFGINAGGEQLWTFTRTKWSGNGGEPIRLQSQYEAVFPQLTSLTIRPAKKGERMKVFGLHGSKKVQDLFVDHKVPRHLRNQWPCIYVEDELVWIPGVARSDSYLVDQKENGWHIYAGSTQMHGEIVPSNADDHRSLMRDCLPDDDGAPESQ